MIRKLLEDKEKLQKTIDMLESSWVGREQQVRQEISEEYEERITNIVEENNNQINSTKQQI